jgi:ABC-type glucose/galactose transport system permease subunit
MKMKCANSQQSPVAQAPEFQFSPWTPVLTGTIGATFGSIGGYLLAPPDRVLETTLIGGGLGAVAGALEGMIAPMVGSYILKKLGKKPNPQYILPPTVGLSWFAGILFAKHLENIRNLMHPQK